MVQDEDAKAEKLGSASVRSVERAMAMLTHSDSAAVSRSIGLERLPQRLDWQQSRGPGQVPGAT